MTRNFSWTELILADATEREYKILVKQNPSQVDPFSREYKILIGQEFISAGGEARDCKILMMKISLSWKQDT